MIFMDQEIDKISDLMQELTDVKCYYGDKNWGKTIIKALEAGVAAKRSLLAKDEDLPRPARAARK